MRNLVNSLLVVLMLVNLAVAAVKVPTANLTANPTAIVSGDSVQLNWTSTNGVSATLNGTTVSLIGSQVVTPAYGTTYTFTVKGRNNGPLSFASSSVTISVTQKPVVTSVVPSKVAWNGSNGNLIGLNETGFDSTTQVLFGDMPQTITQFAAATFIVQPINNSENVLGPVDITVTNPGPPSVSTTLVGGLTFTQSVKVSPPYALLNFEGQAQFSAAVTDPNGPTADQSVVWKASGGTIDQNGLWTAPASGNPARFTITATSNAEPAGTGTAAAELCVPVPNCP